MSMTRGEYGIFLGGGIGGGLKLDWLGGGSRFVSLSRGYGRRDCFLGGLNASLV